MQIAKTLNQTGRLKLGRSEVKISLDETKQPPEFNASFDISGANQRKLGAESRIFVEAYRASTLQRFDFGTVGEPRSPQSTVIDEVALDGSILFRAKVVDVDGQQAKLLATAEKLSASVDEPEGDRESLLTVRTTDLGERIWSLELGTDSGPVLQLNRKIPGVKERLMGDPLNQAIILPAVLREILVFILWGRVGDFDEDSWQKRWIEFASQVCDEPVPGSDVEDPEQLHEWAESVVTGFSEQRVFASGMSAAGVE